MSEMETADVVWRFSGVIDVAIMARGGKIVSLVGPDGHEWLAQPAGPIPRRPVPVFTDAEMCGWDECAPTIETCVVDGVTYPDHGELWSLEWAVCETTADSCLLAFERPRGDYRLERRASVTGTTLRLDYAVTAASRPLPWLWVAHPQFAVSPEARVDWPGIGAPFADTDRDGAPLVPWDDALARIGTLPQGGSRKFYVDPRTPVSSATLHDDGRTLRMEWTAALRYLGFWFERSRFARTDIIAIEPASGYYDALTRALALERVPVLAPGETLTWTVTMTL